MMLLPMSRKKSDIIVVKVGSGLLTNAQGGTDEYFVGSICRQMAALMQKGVRVILVSSGAISAGMTALGLKQRPTERSLLQACATIGQPLLMRSYSRALARHNLCNAQILLTGWDLDSRTLFRNTQATLKTLLTLKNCLPIFNENDALSYAEIDMLSRFGDNDRLSGQVALLAGAKRLIILSGIDGLNTRADGKGELVRKISKIDEKIEGYAGQTTSQRSVGGMVSKLVTAKLMLQEGIQMVIANGREKDVLLRIQRNEAVGSWFQKGAK